MDKKTRVTLIVVIVFACILVASVIAPWAWHFKADPDTCGPQDAGKLFLPGLAEVPFGPIAGLLALGALVIAGSLWSTLTNSQDKDRAEQRHATAKKLTQALMLVAVMMFVLSVVSFAAMPASRVDRTQLQGGANEPAGKDSGYPAIPAPGLWFYAFGSVALLIADATLARAINQTPED